MILAMVLMPHFLFWMMFCLCLVTIYLPAVDDIFVGIVVHVERLLGVVGWPPPLPPPPLLMIPQPPCECYLVVLVKRGSKMGFF